MANPTLHFLLPRRSPMPWNQLQFLHRNLLQARQTRQPCRHVTGSPASKPGANPTARVLEKPDKFRPPSHGRRLKAQVPRNYGPALTKEQRIEQKTKQYPRMFPPEGSFMFWFLTNRGIHLWISLGTLSLLAAFTMFENWRKDTPFKDRLPSKEELMAHPIQSLSRVWHLVQLSTHETSMKTDEMRKHDVNDVQKRNTYRKHHGIEDKQGLGPWMPAEEKLRVWKENNPQEVMLKVAEETQRKRRSGFLGIHWS